MFSKHNYGISMDLVLPDGSTKHIFHEYNSNNKIRRFMSDIYRKPIDGTAFILSGIPCSGKSTFALQLKKIGYNIEYISRDAIRLEMYNGDYRKITFSPISEQMVTNIYNGRLRAAIEAKKNIILDNTHCRSSYLKEAIYSFAGTNYKIYVKFFDIPVWKAYIRNVIRYIKERKWIPMKVLRAMDKNYKKINKNDYEQYKW